MSAPRAEARLNQALDKIVSRLKASDDDRDVALLAGLRAAQNDPRAQATYVESLTASAAVRALVLGRRWVQRHGGDGLGEELIAGAEAVLDAVATRLRNLNDPVVRTSVEANVAAFFDAVYPPEVARIVADGDLEVHDTSFSCQPGAAAVEFLPAVAGKRRRLLAIRVYGSPYAPTAELVAVPSRKFLLALDSRDAVLELRWQPAGWCEAPPGEAILFQYLGRIASTHSVDAMSILM